MIYLKLTIAFFLAALPFFYAHYVRPRSQESKKWRSLMTVINTYVPQLKVLKDAVVNLLEKFGEGLKKSENFRKFFTLVILLFILIFQFIDFNTSHDVAMKVQQAIDNHTATPEYIRTSMTFVSNPNAIMIATFGCFSLFWFKVADRILTVLHNNQNLFLGVALLTLILLFMSPTFLILSETLEVLLMAAMIYPNKIQQTEPKGRKQIPLRRRKRKLKMAA